MPYYDVIPLSPARQERYTYKTEDTLPIGSVAQIRFGRKQALGIIWDPTELHPKAATAYPTGVRLPESTRKLAAWTAAEYLAPLGMTLKQSLNNQVIQYAPPEVLANHTVKPLVNADPRPKVVLGFKRRQHYRERADKARRAGQSVLIVVPEINLSPGALESYSGTTEAVAYHSRLTPKQRALIWWHVAWGKPVTVVGTRSALWLPWQRLGLIVVDEEDDPNFKQEQVPRYHARPVAARLAQLTGATVVYGSASPSLEVFMLVRAGSARLITISEPAVKPRTISLPTRRANVMGYELWDALRTTTERQELAVLYAPKSFHQRLQAELEQAFPGVRSALFAPEARITSFHKQLRDVASGSVDILIGGSALARDWGFRAELVGLLALDYLLNLPDFRATERNFGLLRKLSGLVALDGAFLVQTAGADHPALTALREPYAAFAGQELAERAMLHLPPSRRLTRLLFTDPAAPRAEQAARNAVSLLRSAGLDKITVSAAAVSVRNGIYRWQVLVTGDPANLIPHIQPGWDVEVDPVTLL